MQIVIKFVLLTNPFQFFIYQANVCTATLFFMPTHNKFVFTPNKKRVHAAIFTAEALGYSPAMAEFVLTARKMVALDVKAVGFNANNTSEISFIANSDVIGTIAYKTDYSGLMIVLAVIITSVVVILFLRDKIHYLSDNFHIKIHNKKKISNNESDW